ncbi:glutamate-gated chloride channel alpha-like isoform X2 [Panulirus ornatus]|uniref:glutamate-gated chloride channel alpha-like isoform X2 n=1 Tax=Panulirus ornatus TaxID=150431 RepID=UPI003A856831
MKIPRALDRDQFGSWASPVLLLCVVGVDALDLRPPNYDSHIRPQGPEGGPVTVGISMRINAVNWVDENNMMVGIEVYFRTSWKDPRLLIPQDLFVNTTKDFVPLSSSLLDDLNLWLPDPTIERVQEIHSASLIQPFSGIRLYRDGKILWSKLFIISLGCPMFFHDFPFDKQICPVDITSYYFGTDDMNFDWHGLGVTASEAVPKLLGDYHFSFQQENATACVAEDFVNKEYPCLRSTMVFTRRYKNHLMGVYVPSSLFVLVAWASFFWPPDAIPARTVLLITSLLTIISIYANVQQLTPSANYTRAVDIWFFACILAVASALFQYAVILQLRVRQPAHGVYHVKPAYVGIAGWVERSAHRYGHRDGQKHWRRAELRVELGARLLYPVLFLLFNIPYWIRYL